MCLETPVVSLRSLGPAGQALADSVKAPAKEVESNRKQKKRTKWSSGHCYLMNLQNQGLFTTINETKKNNYRLNKVMLYRVFVYLLFKTFCLIDNIQQVF